WRYARTYMCFFFQAEDGIRDRNVTGVQTCALPISDDGKPAVAAFQGGHVLFIYRDSDSFRRGAPHNVGEKLGAEHGLAGLHHKRSEEHTSELQSRFDLVCRLLLEKKKKNNEHKLTA